MITTNQNTELLDEFVKCLNEERYFDAHVAIETIWFKQRFEDCDEIRLLKGFINAAVSFELIKRGRIEQSKKVWKNYLKYRQLLYKVDSPHLNKYYQISRHLEKIKLRFYKF